MISNRCAALENLNDGVDINKPWEGTEREYESFNHRV